MSRRLRGWGPALLWAAVLFWLSSRPTVPGPDLPGLDKLAHFAAYALLGALLSHGARRSGVAAPWIVGAGWLYALSDEVHQGFVPGRSPEAADWLADAVGVLFGIFVHTRWLARAPYAEA
ncbi:MAG TPA: VanZ family protein [Longimicrobiaceae bacterium]|nr:VanZ family protein [Longimicrobiaceae bacterium]